MANRGVWLFGKRCVTIVHACIVCLAVGQPTVAADALQQSPAQVRPELKNLAGRVVGRVEVVRQHPNKYVTEAMIRSYIPYLEGQIFAPSKTNRFIKNLYALGLFQDISVRASLVGSDKIDVFVILDELPEVVDIQITGNNEITDQKLEEELRLSQLRAISKRRLDDIVRKIKKMYYAKDYHLIAVDASIKIEENNKAVVVIDIHENDVCKIERVVFKGNKNVSARALRHAIFTREDWLFGFASGAGSYQKDKLEKDKRFLENFYKTLGYLTATITDVQVQMNSHNKQYEVTFFIEEGDLYHVGEVHVQGSDLLSEFELLRSLALRPGAVYSAKDVYESMETIKKILGEFGYVFIDVQPMIVPDEHTKTANVTFDVDLGSKVYLNRLTIKGNEKTRDYVIRRRIGLVEGDLITYGKMDASKDRVEALSFWNKDDGVLWKINRINDSLADLDLITKEVKTGKISAQIGYGGFGHLGLQSPSAGANIGLDVHQINLFGKGLTLSASAQWSTNEWACNFDFAEPFLMDYPVSVGYNMHVNSIKRDENMAHVDSFSERYAGTSFYSGYIWPYSGTDIVLRAQLGIENVKLSSCPLVRRGDCSADAAVAYQEVLNQTFKNGTIFFLEPEIGQDMRNHIMHPSAGFQWLLISRIGFPTGPFGFFKLDFDYAWYTSLIDEYGLVFGVHTHFGYVRSLRNKTIPFRELYNIGGDATVRGFKWGEVSPSFVVCGKKASDENRIDPIGGEKAFFINLELMFPLKKDYTWKGAIFYDGGSGWQVPKLCLTEREYTKYIRNSCFDYRQSIGIGLRMLQPQPLRVDWAFKLDRRTGESTNEVHFGTYREF